MPTYVFRCAAHGAFDHRASMTAVPDAVPCPTCAAPASRRVAAPSLTAAAGAHHVAAAHERSAHAPGVVSAVPAAPGARRPASTDPRHARLPRP